MVIIARILVNLYPKYINTLPVTVPELPPVRNRASINIANRVEEDVKRDVIEYNKLPIINIK